MDWSTTDPVTAAGWFALQKIDRAIAHHRELVDATDLKEIRRLGLAVEHDWTLMQDAAEELRRALIQEGETHMAGEGGVVAEIRGPGLDMVPARVESWKGFLERVGSPEGFKEQQDLAAAYDLACKALIGPNDIQIEGEREFKKKTAWLKLGRHFNISTFVVSTGREYVENVDPETLEEKPRIFIATVVVRGVSTWGQIAEAVGACATDEESGQRIITIADALATAQTRATNRAISNLIAMGEVSAEEIQKGKNGSGENGPPQRKQRPAAEFKMPFGPSKGALLGKMETGDLAGALRWAEDKSEEKGSIQFGDFQKAAKEELARRAGTLTQLHEDDPRRKGAPAPASGGGEGRAPQSDTTPTGDGVVVPTLEEALKYPFPFRRGTKIHGRPLAELRSEILIEIRDWIREQQQTDETFHQATILAINVVLAHREQDQTRLELTGSQGDEGAKRPVPASGSSQDGRSGSAAPSGGGKPEAAGKTDAAPGSRKELYRRAEAALKSEHIPESMRDEYRKDMINGFRTKGRPIEYWIRTLEATAKGPQSVEIGGEGADFPTALQDEDDDLPF